MTAVTRLVERDEPEFAGLTERHRRGTFEGRSTFRAWIYRIAINARLDLLARRRPEPATGGEVPWPSPIPSVAAAVDTIATTLRDDVRFAVPRTQGLIVGRDGRRPAAQRWSDHRGHDLRPRPVPAARTALAAVGGGVVMSARLARNWLLVALAAVELAPRRALRAHDGGADRRVAGAAVAGGGPSSPPSLSSCCTLWLPR